MDRFMHVADPARSLRLHNSTYVEQVKRAQWRAQHVGARTAARSSLRGARQSLGLAE